MPEQVPNRSERITISYSADFQGMRLCHAKYNDRGIEEVREFIVPDGDPGFENIFKWVTSQHRANSLGVIHLDVTDATLAEFNRLFEKHRSYDFEAARLKRHLEEASRIVAAMPEWKRNVLRLSGQPTVSTPRKPVGRHWQEPNEKLYPKDCPIRDIPKVDRENQYRRAEFAKKMIGSTVHVYKLGGVHLTDDPNTDMYLPLPEYGICLMTFKPRHTNKMGDFADALVREYSHGEAMAQMMPRSPGQDIPLSGNDMLDAIHKAGNV